MARDDNSPRRNYRNHPPIEGNRNKRPLLTDQQYYKAEYYTYEDEIAAHYSSFELDFEIRCRLARIQYEYIERGIDSDVDEYGEG